MLTRHALQPRAANISLSPLPPQNLPPRCPKLPPYKLRLKSPSMTSPQTPSNTRTNPFASSTPRLTISFAFHAVLRRSHKLLPPQRRRGARALAFLSPHLRSNGTAENQKLLMQTIRQISQIPIRPLLSYPRQDLHHVHRHFQA
ncbi:hypothetical protein K456DRAFT_760976 [Colletotrichum gloeosporioides 23]|nr:hypothetical protein K456DRAFT_760976 [Colletotrichum gloeosporioides 23]